MLETDADRLALIKGLGGQLVRTPDAEFWAIFDNDYGAALGDDRIESREPALICRESDTSSFKKGTPVTVGATPYKVVRNEPDGTGMAVLRLARVS